MAGHSKWANIKFRKEIVDKKKSKVFTKLMHQVTVAAREGSEIKLRLAVEKAQKANVPSTNIDRAIKRGTGELSGVNFEEVKYEAIGPNGVAFLILATTDNKNRTSSEVKNILTNNNAKMTGAGSVNWIFEPKGVIRIETENRDRDEIELIAIEAGAEDILAEENEMIIYTKSEKVEKIKNNLESSGINIVSFEISLEPKNSVNINDQETANKILKLMEELDDLDEITSVSSNFDIPSTLIDKT